MNDCFLYAMQQQKSDRMVKIGVSNDPGARLLSVQTGSPSPIGIVFEVGPVDRRVAFKLEGWLHRHYDEQRAMGEWFAPAVMGTLPDVANTFLNHIEACGVGVSNWVFCQSCDYTPVPKDGSGVCPACEKVVTSYLTDTGYPERNESLLYKLSKYGRYGGW